MGFYHQDERDKAVEIGGIGCLVILAAVFCVAVLGILM